MDGLTGKMDDENEADIKRREIESKIKYDWVNYNSQQEVHR